ncbi:UDP-glycosyltransferase 73C4-like [Coffea eugenioides]|uniref:UDP-glycosyltransferase 73C4-like n=1 Tax=Coffea eugenioides TaxID=49369 RepID=UPI000F614F39|nr:UDP-glycosyltransferase 73C4-like [Coffea eugenioides]
MAEKFEKGKKTSVPNDSYLKWLDSIENNSVMAASVIYHSNNYKKLVLGRKPQVDHSFGSSKNWLIHKKLKNGQNLVPSSIEEFLIHYGWNSTVEGICSRVTMIRCPLFAVQFFTEELVVNVLRTGVRIGVETCTESGEVENILVTRKQVKVTIDKLFDEGEEVEERRNRAKKLSELAKHAVQEGVILTRISNC